MLGIFSSVSDFGASIVEYGRSVTVVNVQTFYSERGTKFSCCLEFKPFD